MTTIKLGKKKYTVDYISGRALREIGDMESIYNRASDNAAPTNEDMDTAIKWLCVVFGNQFTPDEVLDLYPSDKFWADIFLIYLAVKGSVTQILIDFPTNPEAKKDEEEKRHRFGTWFTGITKRFSKPE